MRQLPYRILRSIKLKDQGRNNDESFSLCLSPESYEVIFQAGLLACPVPVAFPFRFLRKVARGYRNIFTGLTAAGTAPDYLPVDRQVTGFPFNSGQ